MSEEMKMMLKGGLADIETKIDKALNKYDEELKASGAASDSLKADLKAMSEKHAEMKAQLQSMSDSVVSIQQKGVMIQPKAKAVSIGKQFVEGEAFKAFKAGNATKAKMEFMNNTILGETTGEPTNDIVPLQTMAGIIPGAFRALRLLDVLPVGTATGNTIHYTRELVYTNAAAEVAEGAAKPETTLTFEGVDAPVRTIAHWIKVSKQVMDDAPMLQSYIESRLSHGLLNKLESEIIAGNGTAPNISGILDSGNFTAATVVTADNDFDFANRIKYQLTASDFMADFYLINPADWGRLERTKTGISSDKSYLAQEGAISYINNGMTPTLWGLPVIMSNNVTAGQCIIASREALMFWNRQGVTVEIFEQDNDNVQKNLLTVRAEMRGAFTVFRPSAIVAGEWPDYA